MDNPRDPKYLASYIIDAHKRRGDDALQLSVNYEPLHESPSVKVIFEERSADFEFGHTPFNPEGAERLVRDKWSLYRKTQDELPWPHTESVHKTSARTNQDIRDDVVRKIADPGHPFEFPIVLKPNKGSLSRNVFIANDENELLESIQTVRNDGSNGALMLIQQYLGDEQGLFREIRGICLDGETVIAYEKATDQDIPRELVTNPAHWPGVKRHAVDDAEIIQQIDDIAQHLYQEHGVSYIAFDTKCDRDGNIWLIEGNSAPMGLYYVEHELENGSERIRTLTDKMLDKVKGQSPDDTDSLVLH